jgi:outer membrane protein OmpA-like peptidoglycan-associated protein
MEARIVELARTRYPQFLVQPFSSANVAKSPIVLVGTFTGINKQGQTSGTREAYRICLALADLKTGKIVGKGTARAQLEGVDVTPTAYFRDSPAWMREGATDAYVNTCQGTKIGDAIQPVYLDGILTAGLIGEAIAAYDGGQYREALDLYTSALRLPAGNQLRVHNGIYLTNWRLGRRDAAAEAFGKIVDYGLTSQHLAVKFLFKPGSTAFWPDRQVSGPYPFWLKEIAKRTSGSSSCLEITGHTSRTGPEPLNERLSHLRAEYIKQRLESEAPQLSTRTIATGVGSRENLIGTGKDDLTDALDRRVVFKVMNC